MFPAKLPTVNGGELVKKYIMLALAAAVLTAFLGEARAQLSGFPIYSVKFVCGLQTIASTQFRPPAEPPVKQGNYATLINIHNFHRDAEAFLQKKAVVSIPESQLPRPSPTSRLKQETLNPNQAIDVDCTEIVRLLATATPPVPPGTTFITGFVEIQSVSGASLSVTAVYTSQTCISTPGIPPCTQLGQLNMEVVPQPAFTGP
jgi:hypothetical protein